MLTIAKEEKVLAVGVCQSSNLYRLDIQSTRRPEPAAVSSVAQLAKTETHSKGMVYDLIIAPDSDVHHVSSGCAFRKLHRLPFPTGRTRALEIGGLIHSIRRVRPYVKSITWWSTLLCYFQRWLQWILRHSFHQAKVRSSRTLLTFRHESRSRDREKGQDTSFRQRGWVQEPRF
jgi:hypothetical protein